MSPRWKHVQRLAARLSRVQPTDAPAADTALDPRRRRSGLARSDCAVSERRWCEGHHEQPAVGARPDPAHTLPHFGIRGDVQERVRGGGNVVPACVVLEHDTAHRVGRDARGDLQLRRVVAIDSVPGHLVAFAETLIDDDDPRRTACAPELGKGRAAHRRARGAAGDPHPKAQGARAGTKTEEIDGRVLRLHRRQMPKLGALRESQPRPCIRLIEVPLLLLGGTRPGLAREPRREVFEPACDSGSERRGCDEKRYGDQRSHGSSPTPPTTLARQT